MNKGLYRTVFNKKHGTMVAVAETTNSRGKGKQAGTPAPASPQISDGLYSKLKTTLKTLVCSLVSVSMVLPAHAQITADKSAPKNQQAVILKTNTGAPLVNIQTPNARGLSHNRYTQFDVDGKGAVLNNDRNANPFLAKGSAQLILNEVRGAASKLNGMVTVGGQKADVIIANPNGITVNGGGFKNVGRGILTTGTPQIGKDGALTGFDVRQGVVTVGQAGWNDKGGADYTEVLARAVALQGKLQGKNLAVSTGAQKVDYVSGEISAGTATGIKPTVALDTAALGGMYADSITLIANEKGIGVKNAGTLEAAKQLLVTSSGRIENSGRIATTDDSSNASPTYLGIEATGKGAAGAFVSNGGKIESKGLLVIDTGEDIGLRNGAVVQNNGSRPAAAVLDAGRHLLIEGRVRIANNKGPVNLSAGGRTVIKDAGIQAAALLYSRSKADTVVQAGGRLEAGKDITLLSERNIGIGGGLTARGGIRIEAAQPPGLQSNGAANNITLTGGSLRSAGRTILLADGGINIKVSAINTSGNLYAHAGRNLNLNAGKDLSSKNISLKSGGTADINGGGRTLTAAENIEATAGTLQISNTGLTAASGNIRLGALQNGITMRNVRLDAAQNIDAAAPVGNIVSDGLTADAAGGRISLLAGGDADFAGRNTLTAESDVNAGSVGKGRLRADNTDIKAATGGIALVSGGDMQLGNGAQRNSLTGNGISVRSGGSLTAGNQNVNAGSGALVMTARKDLTLQNVQTASTQNTVIAAENGHTALNGLSAVSRRHMAVSSRKGAVWQNHRQSTQNHLSAQGVLSVYSGGVNTVTNSRMAGGAVRIKSENSHAGIWGSSAVTAVSSPLLKNDAALKTADGSIGIESTGNFTLQQDKIISADGDVTVNAGGRLNLAGIGGKASNPSAVISNLSAKGELKLIGGEIEIQGAKITAGKDLTLVSNKGQLEIKAVENQFDGYVSSENVSEVKKQIGHINSKINNIISSSEYVNAAKNLQEAHTLAAVAHAWQGRGAGFVSFGQIQDVNKRYTKAKEIFDAYDKPVLELKSHKSNLEKLLSIIQSPARGHEHRGAELSGSNVTLASAQGINVSGSKITAAHGQAVLQAAGLLPEPSAEAKGEGQLRSAVNISGVFDTFEYGQSGSSNYAYALFSRPSEISGKTGVTITAPNPSGDSRIILSASDLSSDAGKVTLKSYSDQLYTAGQGELYTFDQRSYKTGRRYNRKHVTEIKEHRNAKADPVHLTAAKGIEVKSGGSLHAYATVFDAPKGTVDIQAGRELKLFAVDEISYDKLDSRKKRKFLGITYDKVHDTTTGRMQTALPGRVVAESAGLKSGWDTLLQGTEFQTGLGGAKIQAGVGEQARADAKIILEGIKTTLSNETDSTGKSALWQKQANRGSVVETLKLPSFAGPTAPILTAPGGFIADIPKGRLKDEIEKLAKQPEYAYLKQLQTAKNVDWNQVQLAYDKWDYKSEGMTGAAAAVVVIAVTVLTYGYGAAAAGGAAGGTAAGAGAGGAAAGTAAGTGAAAGSAAAGSAAAGASAATIGTAAGKAALASLASQAAVSLINNKGNLEKTLKELGKSSTVKQLAAAAVTAGVLQGIGGLNTDAANAVARQFDSAPAGRFTANLINTAAAAGVNTAVNGGSLKDNLGSAALGALAGTVHGEVSSKIKANLSEAYIAHKIAHAVAGCAAAAAANKGKCRDGAIGAAVGEIVGEAMLGGRDAASLTAKERQRILGYSQIVAGSAVALLKGDVDTAANAAAVAVEKNALDTIWDVGNLIWDGGKWIYAKSIGDKQMAREAAIDFGVDAAATLVPFVPAGATKIGRSGTYVLKNGDEVVNSAKAIQEIQKQTGIKLTYDKVNKVWTTPAGLDYGLGSVHGNRIKHVLDHTLTNHTKPTHTVFNVSRKEVLPLIDEAWKKKGSSKIERGLEVYNINMNKVIGTNGEKNIRIVTKPGSKSIITAYPIK